MTTGRIAFHVEGHTLRGDHGAKARTLYADPGRDVVVLHLQDGPVLVLHPEHARTLLLAQQGGATREGGTAVAVPAELAWPGPTTRGWVRKVVLKAIEVVTGSVAEPAADLIASKVVQRVDDQVEAGLYRLEANAPLVPLKGSGHRLDTLPAAGANEPLLVLVHGTFSNTAGTFAKLWQDHGETVRALFGHYGGRVYGFDHPTLGASPVTNALMLARALPAGALLHLLTHSRGGLVAEVLVRAAALAAGPGLDAQELAAWADADADGVAYGVHRDELQQLVRELALKRVRVERVVRVACPAHGTLLASRRLDAYLSVLQWTLQWAGVPVLPALVDLLGEVARCRTDPAQIPGLEAMMPDRALVRWLHRPLPDGSAAPGALRVVAGEVQGGDGVLSWVKALVADALYWTDNDLVVHTAAMFGGTPRPAGQALCFRTEGADTSHFDYFHTERTAQAVHDALLQDAPAGFHPIGEASAAGRDSSGLRGRSSGSAHGWHLVDSEPDDAAAAPGEPPSLQLKVVNGNLQFVGLPLLVGHYRALQLSGTEAVMDRLLGGVMSRALQAGLYAEAPRSQRIFTNLTLDPHRPKRAPRPAAVIVVGLGDEGSLRGDDIIASVQQAVMAHALREAEQRSGQASFALASTLLGSGGSGVSPGAAAQAVAMGVAAANQRLREVGWPVVGRLEFVELFLDRATEAWQALQVLEEAMPQAYALADTLEAGLGCLRRPLQAGYRGAGHDLVSAVAAPGAGSTRLDGQDTPIEFTLCTRRARNEVRALAPQARLVRQMVSTAARDGQADVEIGRSLFQLLVPAELEPFLAGSRQLVLEVDDSTAGIPWELLDPRRDGTDADDPTPWALRCRLLRKLRSSRLAPLRPASRHDAPVLVVGEPLCDRPDYPPLPGARAEAAAVAHLLSQQGADVEHLEGSEAMAVIHGLLARDWRALHLAGHGLYDEQGGGMVLSSGCVLGPREVQAMRSVPELVFVNCCHLGHEEASQVLRNSLGEQTPLFAATVARQLIEHGVRCVVACGWAVSDAAALAFAQAFYAALLKGRRFIDAVGEGRQAAWQAEPGQNTWAAYQCYGDPDWTWCDTVAPDHPAAPADAVPEGLVSPAELCLQLEALAVQSQYGQPVPVARIQALETLARQRWPGLGAVWEALGVAYAEAGALADAVRCHREAVAAEDGSASLRAAEQWGNLAARCAAEAVLARPRPGAALLNEARATLDAAQQRLTALVQLQPTVERLGLLASALKRRLLVESAAGDTSAARAAFDALEQRYAEAATLAERLGLPAPLSLRARQHAACCAVWRAPARLRQLIPPLRNELQATLAEDPDFWTFAGLAELDLLEALADGRAAEALPGVLAAYTDLHLRMPAPRLWRTVEDQLRFLIATARLHAHAGRAMEPALPALSKAVAAWTAAG
jgi:hypothetical protein